MYSHGDKTGERVGPFVGFVLLDAAHWNPDRFIDELKEDWGIICANISVDDGDSSLVFEADGAFVAVSLMPTPVPNGEAEYNAQSNYLWPEAVSVAKTHKAHLLVAILKRNMTAIETGLLFVKICATCLRQRGALGIYTSGTVFEPEFYMKMAGITAQGNLPLFNWLYFGLYNNEGGSNGYTYGMTMFDKDEIEVIGSKAELWEIRDLLYSVADHLLTNDIVLSGGETIGLSSDQKLSVTRSDGVAVEGQSIKIAF